MTGGYCVVNTAGNGRGFPLLAILDCMARTKTKAGARPKLEGRKRAELADWQTDDANRLAKLVDAFHDEHGERGTDDEPGTGTQGWFAQKLGITQSAVNHYLNGTNALNVVALVDFAKLLGVAPAQISPTLAKRIELIQVGEKTYSAESVEILDMIESVKDERRREFVLEFVQKMSGNPVSNKKVAKAFNDKKVPRIIAKYTTPTLWQESLNPNYKDEEDEQ